MRLLRWLPVLLVGLPVFLLAILVILNNSEPLQLAFGEARTPELPIGLWLLAAFIGGALVNQLYSLLSSVFRRRSRSERRAAGQLPVEKAT